MAKFSLINPANRLFGEHFTFRADMRAGIHIRASISDVDVTKSKWPTSKTSLMLFVVILTQFGPIPHENNTDSAQRYENRVQGMRRK